MSYDAKVDLASSVWGVPDELYSSSNTRGVYHPFQFVVRLRKDFHELLNSGPPRILKGEEGDSQLTLAFSTFFHETIHWWQHIGSTSGLMLSLAYPGQSHVNRAPLLEVLRILGPKKSLKTLLPTSYGKLADEPR